MGYLFETNRATHYAPRRIQYMVKETAAQAQITKRVYPHLLRHSVATTLLERGMPIEQMQKFLGHSKLETTQVYAESSTAMMRERSQRALSRRAGLRDAQAQQVSTNKRARLQKSALTPGEARRTMLRTHHSARAALESRTPTTRGAPSGERGWPPWPCES